MYALGEPRATDDRLLRFDLLRGDDMIGEVYGSVSHRTFTVHVGEQRWHGFANPAAALDWCISNHVTS